MSNVPEELRFTKTHEWVRSEPDGTITVGISDHAQDLLGDMVFVELPEVGAVFSAEQDCAVVESVKAASDVYAPVAGEITEVNAALTDAPEAVNKEPYGDGWLFRMRPADPTDLDGLMDATAYGQVVAEEAH